MAEEVVAAAEGITKKAGLANKWWTLVTVCVGMFMLLVDITIVNVALPGIQHGLHASFSDLQWVVDAYALSLASLLLTAGSLADLFGRRVMFLIGLGIFTAGSLLCGLAQSPLMLILSRAGQGIGGAAMFATSLALLASAFQGKERGIAFGVWGAITGVAVAVGPVLGGVLTTELSWRWIFFVNLPVGAFAVAVTALKVAESRSPVAKRPDWAGFVTFTAGLGSLVYGLIRTNEKGWGDSGVIICFVLAAAFLLLFLVLERREKEPMLDLSLFRLPTFAGGSIAAFGMSASIFALLLYLVIYLQDAKGYSAMGTGLRLLVLSGGIMVTASISGRLTSKVPIRLLIGPGLLVISLSLVLMSGLNAHSSWTELIPGFIVAGIGVGVVNPPLASTAVGVVEPQRSGMASGINSTFRQVGLATGVAALGSVFGSRLTHDLTSKLSSLPGFSGHGAQVSAAVQSGGIPHLLASLPSSVRAEVTTGVLGSFANALDLVLRIAAVVALVAGVSTLFLIRAKDFAQGSQSSPQTAPEPVAPVGG